MREFSEQELVRRAKVDEIRERGIDPFGSRFVVTTNSKKIVDECGEDSKEELDEKKIPAIVAGRTMTKRRKGRAGFFHIQDRYGQIQIYIREDAVGEDVYKAISPKIALWPTPQWLWTNQNGTGQFKTLETRQWIQRIRSKNYVTADGDICLDLNKN